MPRQAPLGKSRTTNACLNEIVEQDITIGHPEGHHSCSESHKRIERLCNKCDLDVGYFQG